MSQTATLNGRYQIEREIGSGGMARVFRARDLLLDRTVAIKMLRDQFADDPEFLARFRQEARSAGSLSHPNIVTVYDVGADRGREFLVMQLVDGPDLKELLRERGRFSLPDAVRVMRSVCAALDYAHRQGLIHRDVKPQNILIGSDGTLKLTDFGIARALGNGSHTRSGEVFGTVQYISPEQAQGQPLTAASDIYSAGIVFFELVTGRVPYTGDSPIAVAMQHVQGPVPRFRIIDQRAPAALDAILARALAKDPRQRFRSAGEFGQALTAFLQGGAAQEPTQRVQTAAQRGQTATQRVAVRDPVPRPVDRPAVKRRRGTDWAFVLLGTFTSLVLIGLCLIGALIVGR